MYRPGTGAHKRREAPATLLAGELRPHGEHQSGEGRHRTCEERDLLDACLVVEPQQLRVLEWLGSQLRPVEDRVRVALAGRGVEADVLDRRECQGQEVANLTGPLQAELVGDGQQVCELLVEDAGRIEAAQDGGASGQGSGGVAQLRLRVGTGGAEPRRLDVVSSDGKVR